MIEHANKTLSFDEFVVDADRRLLLRAGETVPLRAKAFDVLLALIQKRGEVISKNQLLDTVWENQFVEENNLTVHITALRKALGEKRNEHRYIVTVPGKGYRFVGEASTQPTANFVVERRTLERIVIDEEFEESTDPPENQTPKSLTEHSVDRGSSHRFLYLAIAGLVVFSGLVIAGFAVYRPDFGGSILRGNAPFMEHRVTQLTTNGKVGSAALSPDGKLFAYVIDDVGLKSLWVGKVDGGNHLQLRPAAETTYNCLAFSADSGQLYFSIQDEKNPLSALYTIPALGGLSTKLRDRVSDFALSPDGKRLATGRRDAENDAVVISSVGGNESFDAATFPKGESFVFDSVSWSPDGDRLALSITQTDHTERNELGIVEISTGAVHRVRLPKFRVLTKTSWVRGGNGLVITAIDDTSYSSVPQYVLVYVSYPDGAATEITTDRSNYGESWHNDAGATLSLDALSEAILTVEHRQLSNVWIAPADDLSAAHQITFSSFGRYDGLWGLDWSPDGNIIYTTSDTQNQYLAQMSADGTDQKQLTDPVGSGGNVDSVLTVSGDGRYILFHSDRGEGELDIWRTDIDGTNPKQLTFGGKGFQPAPSPDGKWVYYKSRLNGNVGSLCRVPMDGGDSECLTDKETSWVSFSPDGRYFAASYITDKRRLAIFSAETHEVIKQFEIPKTGTLFMGSRWTRDGKSVTYRDTAYGYWLQDIEGGEPHRLEGLPKEKFYNFSWSRDGRWLAFVRGQEIRDVVLLRRGE
ncbi:MAG: LpqB family beta-propeller domain-containing protein [Pyrinomonadaceae bacterium]